MTDKSLFIPIQRRPKPETGTGGERSLARVCVEGQEPTCANDDGRGHQHKIMAAGLERSGKTAGEAFGLLESVAPVHRFHLEASPLIQVCQKLRRLFIKAEENI